MIKELDSHAFKINLSRRKQKCWLKPPENELLNVVEVFGFKRYKCCFRKFALILRARSSLLTSELSPHLNSSTVQAVFSTVLPPSLMVFLALGP